MLCIMSDDLVFSGGAESNENEVFVEVDSKKDGENAILHFLQCAHENRTELYKFSRFSKRHLLNELHRLISMSIRYTENIFKSIEDVSYTVVAHDMAGIFSVLEEIKVDEENVKELTRHVTPLIITALFMSYEGHQPSKESWCASIFEIGDNTVIEQYVSILAESNLKTSETKTYQSAIESETDYLKANWCRHQNQGTCSASFDDPLVRKVKESYNPYGNLPLYLYEEEKDCLRFEKFATIGEYKSLTGDFNCEKYSDKIEVVFQDLFSCIASTIDYLADHVPTIFKTESLSSITFVK